MSERKEQWFLLVRYAANGRIIFINLTVRCVPTWDQHMDSYSRLTATDSFQVRLAGSPILPMRIILLQILTGNFREGSAI